MPTSDETSPFERFALHDQVLTQIMAMGLVPTKIGYRRVERAGVELHYFRVVQEGQTSRRFLAKLEGGKLVLEPVGRHEKSKAYQSLDPTPHSEPRATGKRVKRRRVVTAVSSTKVIDAEDVLRAMNSETDGK